MKNTWKDDRTIAVEDIADSKNLSKKKSPEPRRPPVKQVKVKCCKCKKEETVAPILAPRSLDSGDDSSYVCNGCIGKRTER